MLPSQRSVAKGEFKQRSSDKRWECQVEGCADSLAPSADTGAWMNHLRALHPARFRMLFPLQPNSKRSAAAAEMDDLVVESAAAGAPVAAAAAASSASSVISSSSKKSKLQSARSMTLEEMLGKRKDPSLLQKLATAFACSNIAYAVVERPEFRAFLSATSWPGLLPSRQALRAATIAASQQMGQEVASKLQDAVVTIACDGWTNVKQQKVTNAVLMISGRAFYWKSFVNTGENNAAWLAAQLRSLITSLILQQRARVIGVVVDNESVNYAAFKLLSPDFPFLVHIPCAAHTVQLVVRNCLAEPQLAPIVEQLLSLIRFFNSKANRITLQQQQSGRGTKILAVLKPCDTRWNSLLIAAQRMQQMEIDVKRCYDADSLPEVPADFFKQLPSLIQFLLPFRTATDHLQSDAATLVTVHQEFQQLRQHMQQHPWSLKWLDARWAKRINGDAVAACTLLSFQSLPSHFNVGAAQQFIINFGSAYLVQFQMTDLTLQAVADALLMEIADFNGNEGAFAGLAATREAAKREAEQSGEKTWQPRRVWNYFKHTRLSNVATALLSLCASEAAVERTFSTQGLVHSKLRNCLSSELVQAEMMLKFNTQATSSAAASLTFGCIELSVDSVVEDEDAATLAPEAVDADEQLQFEEAEDEEEVKEAEPAAAAAAASSAQQRALRRAASEKFLNLSSFISWFIAEHQLTPGCRINADVLLALERHSSKLANTPGTATLKEELRRALKPPSDS